MSNSVDAAIYDYFSLLLAEDTKQAPADSDGLKQAEPIGNELGKALDKAALAQLLAPVAEAGSAVGELQAVANPKAVEVRQIRDVKTEKVKTEEVAADSVDKQAADIEPSESNVIALTRVAEVIAAPADVVDKQMRQADPQTAETEPLAPMANIYDELDEEFQVLFFKVAGLTLAVPLVSLGGIVQMGRVNHIMGRPKWFHGVQAHRDSQLNIVDTCAWVMPEKYDDKLAQSIDYQYIVLLEGSNWGLACESLVNSVKMEKSQVNWRSKSGKRPWLAGIVKQQMCGILNVPALITRLNSGLGSQDPID